jgi:crotonobetainyl-CoA:carnitine CoA-transferase CaiB-like acyl-CoA transferase
VILSIQNECEWVRFCAKVLEDAALATDPRFGSNQDRVACRDNLEMIIACVVGRLTRAEAMAWLDGAGIAYGGLSSLDDLIAHPQRRTIHGATPSGDIELLAPGVRTAEAPLKPLGSVPAPGEHTVALRREFANATDRTDE